MRPHSAGLLVAVGCLWAVLAVPTGASAQSSDEPNYSPVSRSQESAGGESEPDSDKPERAHQTSRVSNQQAGGGSDERSAESSGDEPSNSSGDQPAPQTPVTYCKEFAESYVRSSARKLYRALSGQGFQLEKIQLGDTVEIEAGTASGTTQRVVFGVHRENDDRVAGLVDTERNYRRTFIIASTGAGPVIASQRWPGFKQIATKAECRPVSSRVEYPSIATAVIDIRPFKFWGLRIIWRLPKAFKKGDHDRDNLRDTLAEVAKD